MSHYSLRLSLCNLRAVEKKDYVVPLKDGVVLIRKNNVKLLNAEFDRRVAKGLINPEDDKYTPTAFIVSKRNNNLKLVLLKK